MHQQDIDYQTMKIVQPTQASMGTILIEELNQATEIVNFEGMLSHSSHLARFAKNNANSHFLLQDLKAMAKTGPLASLVAIESAAQLHHQDATKLLINCLTHDDASVRRQATWRLANRHPVASALTPVLQQLSLGGIDTMHAHHTLEKWSNSHPELIAQFVSNALLSQEDPLIRARLVDLLGVLSGESIIASLGKLAADNAESVPVRLAAISSLGCRAGTFNELLSRLAKQDNEIGAYATLAVHDQQMQQHTPSTHHDGGLRVCQLVLAQVDKNLSYGGCGDTGGVASLLVSLGDALARQPAVSQVLTIGLGSIEDAIKHLSLSDATSQPFRIITAGSSLRPMNSANAWEHLPQLKRSIKRCLGHFGGVDIIHLRMLDAGTFAASDVANELGIPVCFSFAPDPQNTVQALQAGQQLSQQAFLDADAQSNLWFRARMLEKMGRTASHIALFPQPKCALLLQDIRKGLSPQTQQSVTIAEGIDIKLINEARLNYLPMKQIAGRSVIFELAEQICATRRHLPLLLSVGRFHPIKGMARIAAAWAADPSLHNTCNLVLVGGNLSNPSMIETSVMQAIDAAVPINDPRRAGLIMLGGRPRAETAQLMVAAMMGQPDYWANGGIYVDGAPKEEFGLALIEALATGLVVVAPSTGGPSTFVDHGDTGILVDPDDDLGHSIKQGLRLVGYEGRILRARSMVEQHYAIDTMADKLTSLYLTVKNKA